MSRRKSSIVSIAAPLGADCFGSDILTIDLNSEAEKHGKACLLILYRQRLERRRLVWHDILIFFSEFFASSVAS